MYDRPTHRKESYLFTISRQNRVLTKGSTIKSTDASHDILREYVSAHSEIVWLKEPDQGISSAINLGLEHAEGHMVGYLGSDDRLCPGILKCVADHARALPFDAIYFDSYFYTPSDGRYRARCCPNIPVTRKALLRHGTIVGLQNVFFQRKVFTTARFNPQNRWSMDYELYLDIIESHPSWLYVARPATVNIFDGNISGALVLQRDFAISVANHL